MKPSDSTALPSLSDRILGRSPGYPFTDPDWSKITAPMNMPDSNRIWDTEHSRKAYEEIQRQMNRQSAMTGAAAITLTKRTLRFKGVVFVVTLEDEIVEFFEDEKNISTDEMRLLEVAYPSDYKRIKSAWMDAWKNLQASRAFDE